MGVIFTLAGIFALALTIVVFVLVVPKAKRKGMTNPFLIFLHDLFNFNQLWLEKIFKFLIQCKKRLSHLRSPRNVIVVLVANVLPFQNLHLGLGYAYVAVMKSLQLR